MRNSSNAKKFDTHSPSASAGSGSSHCVRILLHVRKQGRPVLDDVPRNGALITQVAETGPLASLSVRLSLNVALDQPAHRDQKLNAHISA